MGSGIANCTLVQIAYTVCPPPPPEQASYWSSKKYEVHGDVYNGDGEKVCHLFGTWHEAMFCGEEDGDASPVWQAGTLSHPSMGQLSHWLMSSCNNYNLVRCSGNASPVWQAGMVSHPSMGQLPHWLMSSCNIT